MFNKILFTVFYLLLGFVFLVCSVLTLTFAGAIDNYGILFLVGITIYFLCLFLVNVWKEIPRKIFWIVFGFGLIIIVSIFGTNSFLAYQDSQLLVVGNTEIDLTQFLPFDDNTKDVNLSTDSTLKLVDNLPTMDGATALYPVYSSFARAIYPKGVYLVETGSVMCNKTATAFDNLINSKADIIFIASPSTKQLDTAKSMGVDLDMKKIGSEAFVFFVNSSNPVSNLTTEQIKGIYSGKYTNWNQVGGNFESIKAFQRPEGSGSQSALIKFMGSETIMSPIQNSIASGMGGIISEVANYKNNSNAIGFSFRYYLQDLVGNKDIKMLKVNGVEPSIANIRNKTYPLTTEFFAITRTNPTENTTQLLNWVLSSQGKEIIEKIGYVGNE